MHQQQKAAGVDEEPSEPLSTPQKASFAGSLSDAARETRMAATQTRDAAPEVPLGSQVAHSQVDKVFTTPLVTKDELIDGSKMALSS